MDGLVAVRARRSAPWRSVGLALGMLGLVALGACGDDTDDITSPNVVPGAVFTLKDSSFDFTTLHTFAMPDTVVQFAPLLGAPIPVPRTFDHTILDRVRADLLARGYVDVSQQVSQPIAGATPVTPDFVVLAGTNASDHYNAWVGYPWFTIWGFSPVWSFNPNFNSSWTIVYPWFPVVGVTSFDRGTILVDLIPTKTVNPLAKSVSSAWAGVATAELAGQVTDASIQAAIDEMFRQSPYLTAPVVTPH